MNRFQVSPGKEGIYQVRQSRALHWPSADGKPVIWATAGQFVDLRSNFLCELVQKTGQLHKMALVDSVPAGARIMGSDDAPAVIRDALRQYEAGKPGAVPVKRTDADNRTIDVSQLPSAKTPEPEPEPEPVVETPPDAPQEPSPQKAPRSPRSASGPKDA